jgi:hypothetical protein
MYCRMSPLPVQPKLACLEEQVQICEEEQGEGMSTRGTKKIPKIQNIHFGDFCKQW